MTNSIFRKLTFASLLVAMAVPAGLSAQRANPDAGVSADSAGRRGHGPRAEGRSRGERPDGHHGRRGHHRDMMQQLDLTEAQQAQLRTIHEETRAQAQQMRHSGDRDGMRALHQASRLRVEAVLTPAQRQRAEALRAEGRSAHVARRVAHMRETLGLTDAQAASVLRVFEQAEPRRPGAADNTTPEARRAARDAQRQAVQDQLSQILTPAQMQELAAERAERHSERGDRGERGHRGSRGEGRGHGRPAR